MIQPMVWLCAIFGDGRPAIKSCPLTFEINVHIQYPYVCSMYVYAKVLNHCE